MAKLGNYASGSSLALALAMGLWANPAAAQTPAPAAPATDAAPKDEDIVITGSFIRGAPEDSGIPVESMTLKELENLGSPSNMDLVKNLTEIGSVVGEANRYNAYPIGAQTVNLRNLSSGRTLVLMNGRRIWEQFSATTGRFNNIAQIPNAAIGRVDLVKEGGSTTYGADAVGGVVNYITRHNFDGLEVRGDYRAIKDTDGDYDWDALWGKTGDAGSIMLVGSLQHRSPLAARDRDFADRASVYGPSAYLQNINAAAWSTAGSPGTYFFATNNNLSTDMHVITPAGTLGTDNRYGNGGSFGTTDFLRHMSSTGGVRDPNCSSLGGFVGWSTTPTPVCFWNIENHDNLLEEQENYNIYNEINFNITDGLKFHSELSYFGLRLPSISAYPGDNPLAFPTLQCSADGKALNWNDALWGPATTFNAANPLVPQAGCTAANVNTVQTMIAPNGTGAYWVPDTNPAVGVLAAQMLASDGVHNVFGASQLATLQNGNASAGRVYLATNLWRPFGAGGNPITGLTDIQRNTTDQYRFTGELSDDLPEIFGTKFHWTNAVTYSRTVYDVNINDILVDRLQQALEGLGGPGCDANPATPGIVDIKNALGQTVPNAGVAGTGNCKYFNPFSSAIEKNVYTGQSNPGYIGDDTSTLAGHTAGTPYPGYTAGKGLQNDINLIKWLYVPITLERSYDLLVNDFKIDGDLPLELPGGPISVAFGGQYRYTKEVGTLSNYANLDVNPCGTVGQVGCSATNTLGPLMGERGATVLGTQREYNRYYPVWSAFGEANLPILDNLNFDISARYERFISDITEVNNDVLVPAASIKWQPLSWLGVRAFGGSTFGQVNPPAITPPLASQGTSATFGFTGGTSFSAFNYPNADVRPETGFNWNAGFLIKKGPLSLNVDYYDIRVGDYTRTLTQTNVIQALVVPGQTAGATNKINCSSPLLSTSIPGLGGQPFVALNGPCLQGTSLLNSPSGGGGLVGGTMNYFGGLNESNSGELKTSGIDASANLRFDDVIGGTLVLNADVTKILEYNVGAFTVAGIPVAPAYDGLGTLNALAGRNGQHVAEYRATYGFNYTHGRHNFNWNTRFISAIANDNAASYQTPTTATNTNISTNNGGFGGVTNFNQAACVGGGTITGSTPLLGPTSVIPGAGTGQYGTTVTAGSGVLGAGTVGFCGVNDGSLQGYINGLPDSYNTDVSYTLTLPWQTKFTATVQNLFDQDPDFSSDPQSYDAFTGSPLGRTIRVGLAKKF